MIRAFVGTGMGAAATTLPDPLALAAGLQLLAARLNQANPPDHSLRAPRQGALMKKVHVMPMPMPMSVAM